MPSQAITVNNTNAVKRFINTPATIIFDFTHVEAAPKSPFSVSPSCSPFNLTNPPNGNAFMLKINFDFVTLLQTFGGKPRPNSKTLTPFRLATKKCPSS